MTPLRPGLRMNEHCVTVSPYFCIHWVSDVSVVWFYGSLWAPSDHHFPIGTLGVELCKVIIT